MNIGGVILKGENDVLRLKPLLVPPFPMQTKIGNKPGPRW